MGLNRHGQSVEKGIIGKGLRDTENWPSKNPLLNLYTVVAPTARPLYTNKTTWIQAREPHPLTIIHT